MCAPGPGGGPSCFVQALQCALACSRDGVLGGDRDLIGVLLFGAEKTKVPSGHGSFEHIYVLQELEEPSAASMRTISLIVSAEEAAAAAAAASVGDGSASSSSMHHEAGAAADERGGAAAFGHKDTAHVDLANALWMASMLFNASAAKNTRRRIYLMTNDDNPCAASAASRARALTRSKDLQESHVWIEPFFFAPPDRPAADFDLGERSFWRELIGGVRKNFKPAQPQPQLQPQLATGPGAAGSSTGAAATTATGASALAVRQPDEDTSDRWLSTCMAADSSALLERVRRTAHKKRVLWSSSLTILPGYSLSFAMLSIVRPSPNPTSQKLDARTNEPLQSATTTLCNVHGTAISKGDVFRAYNFGGKWAYFDGHEIAGLGREDELGEPGLTLLGFQDRDTLKLHHNVGPSKFLQPTENSKGSTEAMIALITQMVRRDKLAVARMCTSKNQTPKLVALLPQLATGTHANAAAVANGPNGAGVALAPGGGVAAAAPAGPLADLPAGLQLIELPFAEDIRSIRKPVALSEADFQPSQLESTRGLVQRLRLPAGKSPVGQIANPANATHYNYLQMLALSVPGEEIAPTTDGTLPDSAWLSGASADADAFRSTFALPTSEEARELVAGPAAKKQRTAPAVKLAPPSTMSGWVSAHLQGRLKEMTNPVLKAFCKDQALPVGGKKDDLLARVEAFLEAAMEQDATLQQT